MEPINVIFIIIHKDVYINLKNANTNSVLIARGGRYIRILFIFEKRVLRKITNNTNINHFIFYNFLSCMVSSLLYYIY